MAERQVSAPAKLRWRRHPGGQASGVSASSQQACPGELAQMASDISSVQQHARTVPRSRFSVNAEVAGGDGDLSATSSGEWTGIADNGPGALVFERCDADAMASVG